MHVSPSNCSDLYSCRSRVVTHRPQIRQSAIRFDRFGAREMRSRFADDQRFFDRARTPRRTSPRSTIPLLFPQLDTAAASSGRTRPSSRLRPAVGVPTPPGFVQRGGVGRSSITRLRDAYPITSFPNRISRSKGTVKFC